MTPVNRRTKTNGSSSSLLFLSGVSSGPLVLFGLSTLLLFQPTLHQFDFELLVGDDFLCKSPHLRIPCRTKAGSWPCQSPPDGVEASRTFSCISEPVPMSPISPSIKMARLIFLRVST